MIKRAVVDSGIFIGAKHKFDQWHSKSASVLNAFAECEIEELCITNYVLLETVNFLLRKANYAIAMEAYNYLQNTDRIKIIYVDSTKSILIRKLFEKYKELSLTDCSLVSVAEDLKIRHLFSFDNLFDRVKSIERLECFKY